MRVKKQYIFLTIYFINLFAYLINGLVTWFLVHNFTKQVNKNASQTFHTLSISNDPFNDLLNVLNSLK